MQDRELASPTIILPETLTNIVMFVRAQTDQLPSDLMTLNLTVLSYGENQQLSLCAID